MSRGPAGPARAALARRRAGLLLTMAAAAAGCGGAAPGRVLARGVLPYDLATGPGQLISVELADRFELVVRDGPRLGHARRLELGPPEVDLRALAVVHPQAYVGSDAGWIWEIDLRTLARQRSFAVGAAVQALAADARYLVSADASGAVCLRRRGDGALLQCARAPFEIARLRLTGDQLWMTPEGAEGAEGERAVAAVWSVPALRDAGGSLEKLSTRTRWRGGEVWAAGQALWWQQGTRRRLLTRMASPIRALAVTDAGELAIAAWARSLADAAVVLLSR